MISILNGIVNKVTGLFVLFISLLSIIKSHAQDFSVTTTISPTLNIPQTTGTTLAYTTVISYNNPAPNTVSAVFSIQPTALAIGNVAIVPTGGTIVAQRPGTTIWDISNMNSGAEVTFNYTGTITPTSSSAINLCSIVSTFPDNNSTNNIAAIQTFIRPVLTQPTDIASCSDQSVNKLLVSDNVLTNYNWTTTTSTGTISVQASPSGNRIEDVVRNVGSSSGTISYTVTPSIASSLVLANGDVSTTQVVTTGASKTFTVMIQPIGTIHSISVTGNGTIYYGSNAVFTPNSPILSGIYNWYYTADKTGGPIVNNNGVLTLPFLSIGVHTYYVTVAASGTPFCEGVTFPATITVIPRPVNPSNVFTPNGDAENDQWIITNIEQFPFCTVLIIDEWGRKIYSSEGYTNPWDGTFENKPLPASTYFYIIDLKDGAAPFGGPVTILRKED